MCVIFFSYNQHRDLPLILAANRDEYYQRPTEAAKNWDDFPSIYAGRDLVSKGTWLGITDTGRFAAVTNYRDPNQAKGVRSRGDLVADFLKLDVPTGEYLNEVAERKTEYTGFSLLAGQINAGSNELYYYSNRGEGPKELAPGLYGLSNGLLDVPWPKVARGKAAFEKIISQGNFDKEEIFKLLSDRSSAEDAELPDTGVGIEIERYLSPIFIETPIYGTRCSTVVTVNRDFEMKLEERGIDD